MLKIDQKHIKIKSTSLKYLYEIAAIPIKTREQFLQKLLKRKNASAQKNVRLLKIIYKCISEDEMLNWNDDTICDQLNISKGMLYCHKSYLLRDLRAFYFNWKEIEKEEFNDETKYRDEISLELARAERMHHIGMKKEAQHLFFKIEKLINKKSKKGKNDYIKLFKTMRYSCNHYYRRRDIKKFNFYFKKTVKLGKYIIKKTPGLKSYILMNLYPLMSHRTNFYADKTTRIAESIKLYKLTLIESQKNKDFMRQAISLINLINLFKAMGNFKEAFKYVTLGLNLGKRKKAMDIYFAFKSIMNVLSYMTGKINGEEINIHIHNAISNLHWSNNSAVLKQMTLFHIIQLSNHFANDKIFNNTIYEYTAREIIYNGLNSSLRTLYFMKWTNYLKNIKQIDVNADSISNKKTLTVKFTNAGYMKKLDNSIMEFSLYANRIMEIAFKREFYIVMLFSDFWKGRNCSVEYSNHIYRQLEWITRTRTGLANSNKDIADNAFLGINIMSESQYLNSDELLRKYEQKFKNYAESIIELYNRNNDRGLDIYYMLSFIAEQSQCQELKLIVRKTFLQLEKINPKYIKTQIKEAERKAKEETLNISDSLQIKAA